MKKISGLLHRLRKSEFSKGIAMLATGTVLSQVIPVLFAPVVSRIYEPQDYALVAAYTSVTVILTIIATGMYDSALMIDKEDSQAINTGCVALLITASVALVSFIAFLFLKGYIAGWLGNKDLGLWLFLAPFTILFSGFYQTLTVWNNRKGRYKRLASNRIIMTIITTAATVYFGFIGFKSKGLILSLFIGQAASFLLLLVQTLRNDRPLFVHISWPAMLTSAREHRDFPAYNMPQGLLDGFRESGLIWILSSFFGAAALGSFSFAKHILMRPLQIIGNSVGQVFFQKASTTYHQTGDVYPISKKTTLLLFSIGLPFAVLIFLWGETIFSLVFGPSWVEAGKFSKILIAWLLLSFVASPLGFIPLILKKQKQFFYFSVLTATIPILVFYICGKAGQGIESAMTVYAMTNILLILLFIRWISAIAKKRNYSNRSAVKMGL